MTSEQPSSVVVFGAGGYAGRMVVRELASRGVPTVLGARSGASVAALAEEVGAEVRLATLDDADALRHLLDGSRVLLNCAGPFADTQDPLLSACLTAGTHYTDLSGEVPEVLRVQQRDGEARGRGVLLVPAVGFGVIPTDAAAVLAVAEVEDAVRLEIAYATIGGVSRGTASTVIPGIHRQGWRRDKGALVAQRPGVASVELADGARKHRAVTNPWRADLVTAAVSTGVGTVDTYSTFPAPVRALMSAGRFATPVLDSRAWQSLVASAVRRMPDGPSTDEVAEGRSLVQATAYAADGRSSTVRLDGPDAYAWTAQTAATVVDRLRSHDSASGFATAVQLFGADIALTDARVSLVRS